MSRTSLHRKLKSFLSDNSGSVSIEFVLAMPVLFWAFAASFVFFEGYRQSAINLKAAYTISDMISRETEGVDDNYIDSMYELYRLLTRTTGATTVRISEVWWDENDLRYYLRWSQGRGGIDALTNEQLTSLADRLPVMPDQESVVLVETASEFSPLFNVGLDDITMDNFVFTRPRFASQVAWSGV